MLASITVCYILSYGYYSLSHEIECLFVHHSLTLPEVYRDVESSYGMGAEAVVVILVC